MKAFIRKTEFGFQYRIEGNTGFNYFPDDVKLTPEGMKAYFQRGGRNERELIFCNQQGKESKIYSIVEGKTFAGQKYAIVDHDEQKKFLFDNIVPDAEKLDFLRNHSTRVQDQEADKLTSDQERIKYYLNNCADETKVQYKEFIDSTMTPEVMKELCVNNAKTYGLPAEVEIISE